MKKPYQRPLHIIDHLCRQSMLELPGQDRAIVAVRGRFDFSLITRIREPAGLQPGQEFLDSGRSPPVIGETLLEVPNAVQSIPATGCGRTRGSADLEAGCEASGPWIGSGKLPGRKISRRTRAGWARRRSQSSSLCGRNKPAMRSGISGSDSKSPGTSATGVDQKGGDIIP